jgi:hypothetical protein
MVRQTVYSERTPASSLGGSECPARLNASWDLRASAGSGPRRLNHWHETLIETDSPTMRYYFHIRNGETLFDEEGMEMDNLTAVREEAVKSSTELLKVMAGRSSGQVSRGLFG